MVPHFGHGRAAARVDSDGLVRKGRGRVDGSADVGYDWGVGRSRLEVFRRGDLGGNPNESATKLREPAPLMRFCAQSGPAYGVRLFPSNRYATRPYGLSLSEILSRPSSQ